MESNRIRGHKVEDTAGALLQFESGAIGTISISDTAVALWSWEFSSAENDAYPHVPTHAYTTAGTLAALSVPDLRRWHHPGRRSWWEPTESDVLESEGGDPLVRQMTHFADVIQRQADPLVSARDATKTLGVVQAIKRAASTGETVRL